MKLRATRVGTRFRRATLASIAAYLAFNVVASFLALFLKLPDVAVTHSSADDISVFQVLIDPGTVVSPPLYFIVIGGLLLWGVASRRTWLSLSSTALAAVGIAITGLDEYGGLLVRPGQYTQGRWDLALVLGWAFIIVAASAVICAVARLALAPLHTAHQARAA